MPTNLLKTYNQLLELNCLTEHQRILSLKGVFNRDFVNNPDFSFRKKKLNPTPAEGEDTMEQKIKLATRWLKNGNGELRKAYKSKRRRASMACVLRFPFLN